MDMILGNSISEIYLFKKKKKIFFKYINIAQILLATNFFFQEYLKKKLLRYIFVN